MSREGIVERAEAPELRRPNPIWKWLFLGTLILVGVGVVGVLLFGDLERGGVVTEEKEDEKSRLNFKSDGFSPPTFAKPATVVQEPPPAVPAVPQLPRAETIHDKPVAQVIPPPVHVADAPKEESPEEIARKRRLKGALSGSVDAGTPPANAEAAAERQAASTMDLTVTKTKASVATRYRDLTFTIPKGTQIGCILNTAIQSGQTGMISCTVPEDIYGADNTVVLLDRGSQAMGEYKTATLTYGKRRIFVVWSSIRTPEGVLIDIDSPGTGPLGRAGMGGHIDNHYWERVGIPMLMSVVSFGTQSYVQDKLTTSSNSSQYLQDIPQDTLGPVLNEMARIKPTLHKNQGERVNIFVARDLDLSSVYRLDTSYVR
jgi:type IV secretion system protein VirB10